MEQPNLGKAGIAFVARAVVVILTPAALLYVYHSRANRLTDPSAIDADFVFYSLVAALGIGGLLAIPRLPMWLRAIFGFIYVVLLLGPLLQLYGDLVSLAVWR